MPPLRSIRTIRRICRKRRLRRTDVAKMLPWLPADTTATDAISTMMSGMKTQNDGLPAEEDTILYEAAFKMIFTDKYVFSNRNNLYKATLYRQICWVTNTLHLQELPCYRNQAVKLLACQRKTTTKRSEKLEIQFLLWWIMKTDFDANAS